ncbi:hypothetical protein GCM10028781_35180 [Nostocoides australiense]
MEDLATRTHAATIRQDIHETCRQLVAGLGMTATSYLAGARDSKQSNKWAHAGGPEPRQDAQARLLTAHRVWAMISVAEADYVARNWFIANNPRLEERSPMEAIRSGDLEMVLAACRAFLNGTDG